MRISDWSSDVCSSDLPLASLIDQSPIELVRRQGNSGSWSFESSHTDTDANNLTCIRLPVRIRGNKKQGRQPFVNFMCARYRAFGLRDRWDLVGKEFRGVISMEDLRSEEHTSELQSLMRISYAVFCLKKK